MLNLILFVITAVLFYRWINKTESSPSLKHAEVIELQDFTKDQLAEFNGITNENIYIAIKGSVFDVTRSKHFYGPTGAYGVFAGKDASVGMAKNDTDESILASNDSVELTTEELESLDHWLDFFKTKIKLKQFEKDISSQRIKFYMINHLHIVSTLDGRLTAFDRKTGEKVWSVPEYFGTMVNVQKLSNPLDQNDGVFIPEIASGIGRIYYYSNNKMEQIKIPLKQIINDHSVLIDDRYVFTGQKISRLLKIDANTGKLLNIYGEDHVSQMQINAADDVIFFSRTTYQLLIYDKQSSALWWNISYGEFGIALSSDSDADLISEIDSRSLIDAKAILEHIDSPVMGSFDAFIDRNGKRNLIKAFSFKESDGSFIDEIDGSLYIMPSFKELQPISAEKRKDLAVAKCEIGSVLYPDCMLAVHPGRDLIPRYNAGPKLDVGVYVLTFIFGFIFMAALFIRSSKQQEKSKPVSIQVSDTVLGVGSHGTVVYAGTFEGRRVAVKRLLREFYDLAVSEVKLLRDSDSHPNVVRYYFKEECQQFMYLALELCHATLYDMVEKRESYPQMITVWDSMDPRDAIHQILSGLSYLHGINIVHRDIKPQNILIADFINPAKKLRFIISDFGLGKRLEDDQSFFSVSNASATGTHGWRAPEFINASITLKSGKSQASEPLKITKSIDNFSVGCVIYYIMTNGSHPFGDKLKREHNIIKGNVQIEKLDKLKNGVLARDLVKRMISYDPSRRPTTLNALVHPFFWTATKQLNFIQDVSDRLENESKNPPSTLILRMETNASKLIGKNEWVAKLDDSFVATLGKYRKYNDSVQDLLRVIRNKKHHYSELPLDVQRLVGPLPAGYLGYFTSRYPNLITHIYYFVANDSNLVTEPIFQAYFQDEY